MRQVQRFFCVSNSCNCTSSVCPATRPFAPNKAIVRFPRPASAIFRCTSRADNAAIGQCTTNYSGGSKSNGSKVSEISFGQPMMGLGSKIHLTVLFAENVCKFCYEKVVCLTLAPFNLRTLALVSSLPHTFWLGCDPVGRSRFAAQRHPKPICAA